MDETLPYHPPSFVEAVATYEHSTAGTEDHQLGEDTPGHLYPCPGPCCRGRDPTVIVLLSRSPSPVGNSSGSLSVKGPTRKRYSPCKLYQTHITQPPCGTRSLSRLSSSSIRNDFDYPLAVHPSLDIAYSAIYPTLDSARPAMRAGFDNAYATVPDSDDASPAAHSSFDSASINGTGSLAAQNSRCCYNCGATDSPTWRFSVLNFSEYLCNTCGLWERVHGTMRLCNFSRKLHLSSPTQAKISSRNGAVSSVASDPYYSAAPSLMPSLSTVTGASSQMVHLYLPGGPSSVQFTEDAILFNTATLLVTPQDRSKFSLSSETAEAYLLDCWAAVQGDAALWAEPAETGTLVM
ncbi:hypothetical protein NM688_g5245 [Phlebia brevispora]|uniref:Uncharacterized protein n=1 Tax=Phlebia brevispora TaxID=194682 RepID=A0ACC1SYB4_9APHY|nr:hypothetical protein NM688_g5245 [Phlebia brevispora]